ncbi:MAG: MFS transporter [Acetobacteraceae bacterium]|nr:MFS transporter [Acetobacteraceae bacterium]
MITKELRWAGAVTMLLLVTISYIDRINIAVLITDKSFLEHMHIAASDRASQGFLATAFMLGYGISAFLFTPFCVTLFGVRKGLIGGLVVWGGVTAMSPLFTNYETLLVSRLLLGFAEGPLFSLASSYIKSHFEDHENGRPNSFVNMGTGLGLAIGFPFVGLIMASYHWEMSFVLLGALNIIVGVPLVLAFIRMPHFGPKYDSKPRSLGDAFGRVAEIFRGATHTRHVWLMTVMTCAFLAYLWGSSSWLPSYLKEARGFSLREMGWLASLPQYAAMVAVLIGGFIIDKLERRQVPLIFMASAVGVSACVMGAINVADPYVATYCLIGANFCWGLASPAFPSTVQYCARPEHAGSAFGVVNGIGSLAAGLMPAVMGSVIGSVTASSGSAAGFYAGFAALIGTQALVFVCGGILLRGERNA